MSRLQKKCLIASLFTHGTLLVVMIIGSAFIAPAPPKPPEITIELVDIPDTLIDENFAGGGNPAPAQPRPPVQQPAPAPKPEVRKPEVKKPEPKPEVKIPEPKPEPKPQPVREPDPKPKPKPKPRPVVKPSDVKVNLKPVTRSVEVASNNKPAPTRPDINPDKIGERLASAIESKATGATAVSVPGTGGASYAPYAAYLKKVYETRWVPPQTASGNPVVTVEVVVAKNGRVLSAKITKRSGSSSMDRSIQTVLDAIRQLRPLPETTSDSQRTFVLQFNLD